MASVQLMMQVLAGTVRTGAFLAVVALSLAAWWTLELLLPLGLTTVDRHKLASHYEVAFISGVLVSAGTAVRLARYDAILRPLRPAVRVGAEWACMATAGLLAAAPVLALAHAMRTWQLEEFSADRSLPALAIALAHVCAALAVALRLAAGRGPVGPVAVALTATLLIPGLLAGGHPVSFLTLAALDASAPLRASFDFDGSRAPWTMGVLPTVGWSLLAVALASPSVPGRGTTPPHALRDPR